MLHHLLFKKNGKLTFLSIHELIELVDCIYVFHYENVLSILLCAISCAVVRFALLSSVGSVMSTEWRIVRSQYGKLVSDSRPVGGPNLTYMSA